MKSEIAALERSYHELQKDGLMASAQPTSTEHASYSEEEEVSWHACKAAT